MTIWYVKPDWVFVLVVFFSLYSRRRDAYLSGWILGITADLMSIERLGLLSMGYTLTAVMINAIRNLVFLKRGVTHFAVTLGGALFLQAGLAGYRAVTFPDSTPLGVVLLEGAATAVYTALWAVPIHHILLKFSTGLGLHTSRYTHAGLPGMDGRRV